MPLRGLTVDEDNYITYGQDCVKQPDKYHALLDYRIVDITKVICILECDEWAHEGYPVSCELTRMEQVHEALLRNKHDQPVLFIRYNPNGAVKHDDKKKRIPRKDREQALIELMKDLRQEKITFTKTLNIIYLFYSMQKRYSGDLLGC